jgi:hypothetical protein
VLVSFVVAPYSWLTDQVILIPVILHGLYVTRSRALVAALALASAVLQLSILGGATHLMHSPMVQCTVLVWIGWYLLAVQSGHREPLQVTPVPAGEPVSAI